MPIGKNGNGLTLLERFIPDGLSNAATTLVDSLKINSTSEKVRRRRRVVIKHRNIYGEQLADLANLYFRMSTIPIRFWSKVDDWRRWEIGCFKMLNGHRFRVFASGARTVCEEKLPRKSLWDHMNRGTLTRRMLEAAAHEFRRAHQFWNDEFVLCCMRRPSLDSGEASRGAFAGTEMPSAPGCLVERPFFVSSPHHLVSNRKDSILSFGKTTEKSNRCHPGAILH
jgi:hypothetical protein